MLAEARSRIRRYTPDDARADPDLLIVDTRSVDERVCAQGYSSSLAAIALVELGVDAGDLIGGYEAW